MAIKSAIVIALLTLLVTVFAQTPSFFGTPSNGVSSSNNDSQSRVMTPEEFRKTVKQQNNLNMNKLNNELKDQHSAQKYPQPPLSALKPPEPLSSAAKAEEKTNTTAPPTVIPPPPVETKETKATPQTTAPPTSPPPSPVAPQTPPSTGATTTPPAHIPPPPPPAAPNQNQYSIQPGGTGTRTDSYSGFLGDTDQTKQKNAPSDKNSTKDDDGGWNIHY